MAAHTGLIGLPKYGQSPIDIDDKATQLMSFPPLILNGYWLNDGEAVLKNTGYTANVTLSGDRIPSTVYGGPLLEDEYELHHVEFHWGEEDCNGAEHTINGTWFSMEAQFIHWNRKYLSFEECTQHHDGLCALSYFFLVRDNHNDLFFDKISDHVNCIEAASSEVKIPPNALCWMRQAIRCSGYYTYQGSITHSPFPECVTWIIFPLVIPIQKHQVEVFRNLKDPGGKCIKDNRRPLQLLRGRKIFWANNTSRDSTNENQEYSSYEDNIERAKYVQTLATTDGEYQSPVDLNISQMKTIQLNPLTWHNHEIPPTKLKLTNTGHTVVMSAKWQQERPFISDGPFLGKYVFSQTHMHWGANDMDGSEHYIDGGSLPMELHAVHFKTDYLSQEAAMREKDGITVFVYMFKLQAAPNPAMEAIVKALPLIQQPQSSTRLAPKPIATILRPFMRDYFIYWGTVPIATYNHCILWVVSREPIGISVTQVAEFRMLKGVDCAPLLSSRRKVQDLQNRNIFHVDPSGHRHATLLPIPRDAVPLRPSGAT